MSDDVEICGHETADGSPCQNSASDGDSCWIPAHGGSTESHGRPTKLEKMDEVERSQLISDIATVIETGGSISEAARKVGIHRETIGRWMEKGSDETDGPFANFHDRLVRARGEGEGTYREALMEIAIQSDDTATLMAMLKQRYPDSWGDVNRGEQSSAVIVNLGDEDEYEVDTETLEIQE